MFARSRYHSFLNGVVLGAGYGTVLAEFTSTILDHYNNSFDHRDFWISWMIRGGVIGGIIGGLNPEPDGRGSVFYLSTFTGMAFVNMFGHDWCHQLHPPNEGLVTVIATQAVPFLTWLLN